MTDAHFQNDAVPAESPKRRRRWTIVLAALALVLACSITLCYFIFRPRVAYLGGDIPDSCLSTIICQPDNAPPFSDQEHNVAIEGRIIYPEDIPIPEACLVTVLSDDPISFQPVGVTNFGRIAGSLRPMMNYLRFSAAGCAEKVVPVDCTAKKPITDFVVQMETGFEGKIRFVSQDGHSPSSGHVVVYASPAGLFPRTAPIMPDGTASLPNSSPDPITVSVRADGFQETSGDVMLNKDGPVEFKVIPTPPAKFRVVSDETGGPVPGALVTLASDSPNRSSNDGPISDIYCAEIRGVSGANGEVELKSLHKNWHYWVWIAAEGFAQEIAGPVRAGMDNGEIRLKPGISISGVIRNNAPYSGAYEQRYATEPRTPGAKICGTFISGFATGDRTFRLDGLHPGAIEIKSGGWTYNLDLKESLHGIILDGNGNCSIDPGIEPVAPYEIKVSGRVILPPDKRLYSAAAKLTWTLTTPAGIGNYTQTVETTARSDGGFSTVLPGPGRWSLYATLDGYAPLRMGPIELTKGEHKRDLVLNMSEGFEGVIKFVGPNGVVIKKGIAEADDTLGHRIGRFLINERGEITLPHLNSGLIRVDVFAPGYIARTFDRISVSGPGMTTVLKMIPQSPIRLSILDGASGGPIEGAQVIVDTIGSNPPRPLPWLMRLPLLGAFFRPRTAYGPDISMGAVCAVSDKNGFAGATMLAPDRFYDLSVHAKGHSTHVLKHIDYGDTQTHVVKLDRQ